MALRKIIDTENKISDIVGFCEIQISFDFDSRNKFGVFSMQGRVRRILCQC